MKYKTVETRAYKKSYKKVRHNKKLLGEIEGALECLESGEPMPQKFRDHKLHGSLNGYRELHIRPDVLLIYQRMDAILVIYLIKVGSHAELLN